MEGIERLETQVLEMNNCYISAIFDYLKTRTDLYEKFNNEEKSIEEMYDFITNKAKKLQINHVAMVSDKVVYLWAVTYFNKTNEELGIKEKSVMPPTAKETIKKIEKKKVENKKQESNQVSMFQEVAN